MGESKTVRNRPCLDFQMFFLARPGYLTDIGGMAKARNSRLRMETVARQVALDEHLIDILKWCAPEAARSNRQCTGP